jgi:hypothetical protein
VFQHLHLGGYELELLRGFLADPHQGRAIVWAELLFLGDIVRDFNAQQVRGDFLAATGLLALMRRDRDALCDHIRRKSFRFVEQALLLHRDVLRSLLGGSTEELALEPAVFLFEELTRWLRWVSSLVNLDASMRREI